MTTAVAGSMAGRSLSDTSCNSSSIIRCNWLHQRCLLGCNELQSSFQGTEFTTQCRLTRDFTPSTISKKATGNDRDDRRGSPI